MRNDITIDDLTKEVQQESAGLMDDLISKIINEELREVVELDTVIVGNSWSQTT